MSASTISTFQLFEMFPDEGTAREYLEDRLWPDGPTCPACKSGERITKRSGGYYRCNACPEVSVGHNFTVRTNTIFERSHIPLHKWVYAMYLLVTARKGISSMQLAKEIGVTQKSAWFMLQRLREACSTPDNQDKLRGVIEIDECFIGGKERNKHERKKLKAGRGSVGKTAVLGMRERKGRVRAMIVQSTDIETIQPAIHAHVEVNSTLLTTPNMDGPPRKQEAFGSLR
jgi:transposase-like protein